MSNDALFWDCFPCENMSWQWVWYTQTHPLTRSLRKKPFINLFITRLIHDIMWIYISLDIRKMCQPFPPPHVSLAMIKKIRVLLFDDISIGYFVWFFDLKDCTNLVSGPTLTTPWHDHLLTSLFHRMIQTQSRSLTPICHICLSHLESLDSKLSSFTKP